MTQYAITNEYFNWLSDLVCGRRFSSRDSFRRLLIFLHNTDFTYSIPRDENRAVDGIDLRWQFASERGFSSVPACLSGPCSVLEMMIALVIRCEETIMDDPELGNRTGQWFWNMVVNLGLGSMSDDRFDEIIVRRVVHRFLDREYEPDGRGGLFWIRDCERDLRTMEIWHQMCWYLDSIT